MWTRTTTMTTTRRKVDLFPFGCQTLQPLLHSLLADSRRQTIAFVVVAAIRAVRCCLPLLLLLVVDAAATSSRLPTTKRVRVDVRVQ